jgi:hypothetical protein
MPEYSGGGETRTPLLPHSMCDIRGANAMWAPHAERAGVLPGVNVSCLQDGVIPTSLRDHLVPRVTILDRLQQPSVLSEPRPHQGAPALATGHHIGCRVSAREPRHDLCAHGEYSTLAGPQSARQVLALSTEKPGERSDNSSYSTACCRVAHTPAATLFAAVLGCWAWATGQGRAAGLGVRDSEPLGRTRLPMGGTATCG